MSSPEVQPSPYSTGGGGTTLEHQYGAVLMSHLLSGQPIDVLGDEYTPTKISFQDQRESVDDFVVEGLRRDGLTRRVAIAVRRDPNLVKSNVASVKLLTSFIEFLAKHRADVLDGNWRMALAASADSIHARQLRQLIEIARDQPSDSAFRTAVDSPGRTDDPVRNRLRRLDEVVVEALKKVPVHHFPANAAETTWAVLSALHVHPLLLEGASTNDRTAAISALRAIHPSRTADTASELFGELSSLSSRYAASAATKGSLDLQRDLGLRMQDDLWERQRLWTETLTVKISARRRERRSIAGLSAERISASLEWHIDLPAGLTNFAAGEVLALSGPVGSGKSDTAERWLLEVADSFKASESFSIPVWLRAEEISGSLENAVRRELGSAAPAVRSDLDACIVIDGMDERSAMPDALALEAKVFTAAHPRSRILLTTREGAISGNVRTIPVTELTLEEAEQLIARVSGRQRVYTYDWPESLRASITRPLFALLAAAQLIDNSVATPAALIRSAAELGAQGSIPTAELRKLAVALTWAGKAVDPLFALPGVTRASLMQSRLIVFEQSRCRFALPVFEQWFAAEALLEGQVSVDAITGNLLTFAKWRYVLAACLASGTRETVDPIMNRIAQWNPGALGWLVQESLSAGLGTVNGAVVEDWRLEGERIWSATKSITEGLGLPTALLVRPRQAISGDVADPFDMLSLNIRTDSRRIAQNWRLRTPLRGRLTNEFVQWLPPKDDYITAKEGAPTDSENWLWRWVFNDLADDFSSSLSEQKTMGLVTDKGVVTRERIAWICREILTGRHADAGSTRYKILKQIEGAFQSVSKDYGQEILERATFGFGGRASFTTGELRGVISALEADENAGDDIWPGPDLPRGGWVWSDYSKERMLERVAAIYGGAMTAYEEIRSSLLGSFGLTLGHAALFPANIVGTLRYDPDDQTLGGGPVLSYSIRPVTLDRTCSVGTSGNALITYSEPGDPRIAFQETLQELEAHFAENPESAVFGRAGYSQTALQVFHRRPATYIALDWLWSDLSRLGWATGRAPQHN